MQPDLIIISNGPGEVSTWVRPVARQLRGAMPEARITVALVPCPHASGEERRTIEGWGLGIRVWDPTESVRYLLGGRLPSTEPLREKGVVLFLGGDQAFGVMMSGRTGFPLITYTETTGRWAPWVARFLVSDRDVYLAMRAKRIDPRKITLAGNLMVDAVRPQYDPHEIRARLDLSADAPVVGLLPGSKPFKVKYITPLLLKAADLLYENDPSIQFVLHQSPFTPLSQLQEALDDERLHRVTSGCGGRLVQTSEGPTILTPGGASVRIIGPEHHYSGMAVADLALTVPGTNTAELAILGVPMIVLLPLNKPEEIPLDGLAGQIGNLPLVGKPLKRAVVLALAKGLKFAALPNQRAGSAITPELVGVIAPEEVAALAEAILTDPERSRAIRLALHQAMGEPGAAAQTVEAIREVLARADHDLAGAIPPAVPTRPDAEA
ncbi:MAG TPA: hypothetical protein V6D00_14305 [Pantanalinema sp.]